MASNCDKCSASFNRKDVLLRHKKSHSTNKIICSMCTSTFVRTDNLIRHIKKFHGMYMIIHKNK